MRNVTVVFRKQESEPIVSRGWKAAVMVDGLFVDSVENTILLDYLTGVLSQQLAGETLSGDCQVLVRLDVTLMGQTGAASGMQG